MAGEAEGGPTGADTKPENETPRPAERQQLELGIATRVTLLTEARSRVQNPDGSLREPIDDTERALRLYLQISEKRDGGLDFGTGGNPLNLPEINGSDQNGDTVKFGVNEVSIRQIVSVSDEGMVECTFSDAAGIPITKTVTDPESGGTVEEPVRIFLPREAVLDAQFLSQRELYQGAVDGDRSSVLAAYADSLPQSGVDFKPDSELDQSIENAGGKSGLPTATRVRESVSFRQLPPEQQERLEEFMKGKVILTAEDMRSVMNYMGSDRLGVRREVKALLTQIGELEKRTDEVGQRELEEARNRLRHLEQLDREWSNAEKSGGTPYDGFLQDVQDGRRTQKEAEAINTAILNGDFGPVLDTLPELKNMTDQEKTSWKEYAKKTGVRAGWVLAILLAIPAAAAYAAVNMTASGMAAGRR